MIDGLKIAVVLPAYNASQTLARTFAEIPMDIVDDVILVDDASTDSTAALAHRLGIHTIIHARNGGYGANQKSCYTAALAKGADIVVMVHPDYQYTPRLITAMAGMIASGHYDAVFASRILGGRSSEGGRSIAIAVASTAIFFGAIVVVRGDAPLQICREPLAHRLPESPDGRQA